MSSFSIQHLLVTCRGGKLLEVGCGSGHTVITLFTRGLDVYGIDADPGAFSEAGKAHPDRFKAGTIQVVPFPDETFDTVYCSHFPQSLADEDVATAFAECCRVTSRHAYVVVAASDLRDRTWWEQKAFEAGFRRHPLFFQIMSYEALERESGAINLLLEKIPSKAFLRFPLQSLLQGRELHMDMLRESGRRADAHTIRYSFFSKFISDNDVVVDAACGLGYGSAILWDGTFASCIYGVDNNGFAVSYATENYTFFRTGLTYKLSDAADISFLADESVDTLFSFETVEHVQDPATFLSEVRRILRPGGTFICSVPNLWVDETGKDVGTYHLHSFNYKGITELCGQFFAIERIFAQNAGGGFKFTEHERLIREVDTQLDNSNLDAEWWIVVCVKAPAFIQGGARSTGEVTRTRSSVRGEPDKKDNALTSVLSNWINRIIRKCQKL